MRIRQVLCAVLFLSPAANLQGAFVLDDFDDPAELFSPESEGVGVDTPNVGDRLAARTLSVYDVFTDPVAHIDSSLTHVSHLTITRDPARPDDSLGLARLASTYRFPDPGVDFSEDGTNDKFYVDLTSVLGPMPPPFLYVFVKDGAELFEAYYSLSDLSAPHTAAIPFERFRTRAGGSGTTDFRAVTQVSFALTGNGTVNRVLERGWTVEIDRIRVGSIAAIPEPSSLALFLLAVSTVVPSRQLSFS